MLWLAALVSVLALAVTLAIVWPVRVQASIEGRADPTGFYALASGVSIGPFAVAAVIARGVPGRVQVHILSRLVGTWTFAELWAAGTRLSKRLRKPAKKKSPPVPIAERVAQVERGWARIQRFLDPIAFARFVFAERKRIALDYLDVALRFGGDDVALTGRIVAAIMVLDGMFGARVSLRPEPIWIGDMALGVAARGRVRLYPGRFVFATLLYLVKNVRLLPPPPAAPVEARAWSPP